MDKVKRRKFPVQDEKLKKLNDSLELAMSDLKIAKQGLQTLATWAKNHEMHESIASRAEDVLALMYHK